MKYIINKSQLDKVVFKYLDMELDGLEEGKGKNVDIILRYPGEEYGLVGIEKMGDRGIYVYVYYELIDTIKHLFSMEYSETLDVIGRYIGNRYNLRVIHTYHRYWIRLHHIGNRYNLRVIHTFYWIIKWCAIIGNRYNLRVIHTYEGEALYRLKLGIDTI